MTQKHTFGYRFQTETLEEQGFCHKQESGLGYTSRAI